MCSHPPPDIRVGISVPPDDPVLGLGKPQGNIVEQLESFVKNVCAVKKLPPQLILVILPELGNDLYTAVKQ